MTDFTKQIADVAEQVKSAMPKVSFNANGYEIRTKVLEMAKDHEWSDFHAKFHGWEQTITRDPNTGEVINMVTMPVVPGIEQVVQAAQKFYDFVNGTHSQNK
jgi:hypothetical protein